MPASLLAIAAACLVSAWGPLRHLFREYRDSPTIVYLLFGGFFVALAVASAGLAVHLLRTEGRR